VCRCLSCRTPSLRPHSNPRLRPHSNPGSLGMKTINLYCSKHTELEQCPPYRLCFMLQCMVGGHGKATVFTFWFQRGRSIQIRFNRTWGANRDRKEATPLTPNPSPSVVCTGLPLRGRLPLQWETWTKNRGRGSRCEGCGLLAIAIHPQGAVLAA
jgi:hypothetical protein